MNIQEHLAVFDGWLTSRITEAHAAGKDLAFRDRADEIRLGEACWEYSLLVPGHRAPQGDGWSVYRLHTTWADYAEIDDSRDAYSSGRGAKSGLLAVFSGALFGRKAR